MTTPKLIPAFLLAAVFLACVRVAFGQEQGASAKSIIENAKQGSTPVEKSGDDPNSGRPSDGVDNQEEEKGAAGLPARTTEVEDFVAFVYSPGPRDPFISPIASGTIVIEKDTSEDISIESLMAFAEKLRTDLGSRVRVVGVSVPPAGNNSHALVIYADGRAGGGGDKGSDGGSGGEILVPALPPRTVTVESGIPVRYPPEETAFISRLAQLVAQNSPIRLKRDSRTGSVIFPIEKIDEKGIQVSLPGYEEPILLPVYRELETYTGAGD